MLHDLDDAAAMLAGSGPSRTVSTRIKLDLHAKLLDVEAQTGETPAALIRRLVAVHLDAMAHTYVAA
jgi:predicted DNA-binding protein